MEVFFSGKVVLHPSDCLDAMPTLAANSIDSCVTDPPYGLGFMGKHWDHGVPGIKYWREVFRVLKPGAHLLSFGGTRTYHRMVCAIEDAGFEIRDCCSWNFGQGFPKSLDVSKAIDKMAGAKREVVGPKPNLHSRGNHEMGEGWQRPWMNDSEAVALGMMETAPATDAAREWQGWGTALKPAMELICLARKPLSESTVAANVLKWGTGALNIDGCRVASDESTERPSGVNVGIYGADDRHGMIRGGVNGRWPANVIHDGSDEVVGAFPDARSSGGGGNRLNGDSIFGIGADGGRSDQYSDSGSAARFFYTAKADADDRLGSKHPTVKPVDLMQYLVRLVTPRGGTVLDPFAGTGTTGEAAFREGMRAILIEREPEYQNDIRRRMALVMAGSDERSRESIKAKTKDKPIDHGPLFGPAPAKQEAML